VKAVTLEQVKQAGIMLKKEHEERLRLEKEAGDLKLEKRATQIAFREVELGISEPFKNFTAFQTKVASLMSEDLDVVEKALQRGYGSPNRIGTLDDETKSKAKDPLSRWILDGEL